MPNKILKLCRQRPGSPGSRTVSAIALGLVALGLLAPIPAGCGSPPGGDRISGEPAAPGAVEGDWDDLLASIDAVADRHALGVMRRTQDESEARIELIDVLGRPVVVEASNEGGLIELDVRVGRFGDEPAERRIRSDLARRLGQLHGVDVAPIDW